MANSNKWNGVQFSSSRGRFTPLGSALYLVHFFNVNQEKGSRDYTQTFLLNSSYKSDEVAFIEAVLATNHKHSLNYFDTLKDESFLEDYLGYSLMVNDNWGLNGVLWLERPDWLRDSFEYAHA